MAIVLDRNFVGTPGNTFGDADDPDFDFVAGTRPVYSTTDYAGSRSLLFPNNVQSVIGEATFTGSTVRTISRIWNVSATPATNGEVLQVRSSGARGPGIILTTAGKVYVTQVNGTATWLSTNTFPINTDFRVTLAINGTSITFTWYADETTNTPVETMGPFTLSGAVTMVTVRDGHLTSTGLGSGSVLKVSWPKDSDNTTDPGPRSYFFTYDITIADNVSVTDLGAPQELTIGIGIDDVVGAADSLIFEATLNRTISDSVGISDLLPKNVQLSLLEAIGITDVISGATTSSMSDTAGITDSLDVTRLYERLIDEPIGIVDEITVEKIVYISIDDAVGATDSNNTVLGGNVAITEPVGVTDSLTIVRTFSLTISDNIAILDYLNLPSSPATAGLSITDIEFARLRALGYTGSMMDMLVAWYKDQVVDPNEDVFSIRDLEFTYLRSLGYTGSLDDMRRQIQQSFRF